MPSDRSPEEALARLETAGDWGEDEATRWAGRTDLVDPLVERLVADDERTRRRAAAALGWVGDAAAVDPLVGRLRADEDAAVRERAAVALGAIGDREAVDELAAAVETEPAAPVRRAIAAALVRCGGVREAVELVGADDDAGVATVVVDRLADGDDRAREAAVELLLTGEPTARRRAARALSPATERTRTALVTALEDDDPRVRARAARSLRDHVADLGPRSLPERVLARLDRASSGPVVAALADALEDPVPEVRRAAVEALAAAPDRPRVRRALQRATDDVDATVREAARDARG